jgi:hypothetical protein
VTGKCREIFMRAKNEEMKKNETVEKDGRLS